MSEYHFLSDFMSYFQMLTLLNFGLIFIDKNSAVIKLQDKIIKEIIARAKPYLNRAGELTQKCRKDIYSKSTEGYIILGLAEMIRAEKEVFKENTEFEKRSMFMPATGFTSGLFCLIFYYLYHFSIKQKILLGCIGWNTLQKLFLSLNLWLV